MSIRIPFTIANGRWRIGTPPEPEVYQLDDNAHKLSVVGDLPDGYAWTMYVSVYGKFKNSILLTRDAEGASVTLTADQLAYGDTKYFMQLVGVNGSITRKTNEISVFIPKSLIDGDADWPETPDVFEQAQEVVLGAVTEMRETGDAIVRNAAAGSSTVYNIAGALTLQGYISYNLGTAVGDNENYVRSPFLFLPKGTRLHLSGFKNADSVATIAVYDAEKTYVQSSSIRGAGISDSSSFQFLIFTMPEDGYVRFSARRVNLADILIRNVPAEKELNILVLGNSFSQDAFAYLPPILNELLPDYAITYGVAYSNSYDPGDHLDAYENDLKYFRWNLWRSGADHWSHYTGSEATKTLAEILPLYDWNVVYLQCAGVISEAGMETSMMEDNIGPGRELLRILQAGLDRPFTFLTGQWLSTVGETEADTLASYFRMREAVKYVADRLGVDGVIPVGAGIAFARMDADLDALGENGHLLYDSHQQAGLPALISAYVIAQYILEMLGREDTAVYGSTFVPDATGVSAINSSAMTHGDPVGVTADNIRKAQEIAVAAAAHPDSVYGEVDSSEGGSGGSAPVTSVNGKTGAVTLSASDVGALPDDTVIPPAVTEQTVSGWGFTKNTGTYSKPSGGIPASDLASAVQTSLGKADTALQTAPVSSVNGQTGAVVIPLAKPGNTHVNVFNPEDSDVEQGYLTAQGKVNYNADYWTTGYIPVSRDDVVRVFFGGANKNHAYAAEFTTAEQSGFVSRTANGSYAAHTVENDGYVRLSIKTSAVAWADRSTVMVTINDTDSTYIAYGDMGANDGLMSAADKKKLDNLGTSAGKKVFDKFLFIAYSSFGSRAPNSVPHFEYCAQRDYDWLKADVQPTSDGGLVCCHDSGFTLDGNGRITTYNSSSATEIYTLTLAQATALTYASYPTTHVASIDDFLEVCKKYGKIPYITIRDAHMDVVVPALMASLDKFALRSVAVINSSTRASLDAVRTADKDITMSLFVNPFGSSMAAGYNYCIADGNTMLGYFYTQSSHTWSEFIADSTVAGYLANCIQNGIVMWAGIESDASHVDDLIEMGFSGVHTMQDRSTPTPTKTSDLTNDSGFQTAQQVQTAIANAAELPTVSASDNGKVLGIVNGAYVLKQEQGGGLTDEAKQALLDCFENVAWINDQGQTYYDALYAALYPPKTLVSISAAFNQGSAVIYATDSLDSLKQYLTVTATYDDSSTGVVTNYTLSGTLTEGTSVINVSYGGKTTTFTVTVTEVTTILPVEYQEVEWVGRTATTSEAGPYIDTGFAASEKAGMTGYDIKIDALARNPSILQQVGTANPLVSWSGNSACYFGAINIGDAVRMGAGYSDSTQYFAESVTVGERHSFRVYWDSTSIHAESEGLSCTRAFIAGSANLHLRIGTGAWEYTASGAFKVFGNVTIKKDGSVVSNLVPCYRKTDSVIGFYDTIRETFYTNAGSGSFEKGADI